MTLRIQAATARMTLVGLGMPGRGQAQSVQLTFHASDPAHQEELTEYRAIWAAEGARMIQVLERVSSLTFPMDSIDVQLVDGPSWAGTARIGMRATYPSDTKRATLTHELGHILIGDIPSDADGAPVVDYHAVLFLFLYDVWVELWGEDFARAQVAVESARRGRIDYEGLWQDAMALSPERRAVELRRVLRLAGRGPEASGPGQHGRKRRFDRVTGKPPARRTVANRTKPDHVSPWRTACSERQNRRVLARHDATRGLKPGTKPRRRS